MCKLLLLICLTGLGFLMTACVSTYGNFTGASCSMAQQMADKTADQLILIFPPAQIRFNLEKHEDSFGHAFIQALRLRGYAISVIDPQASALRTIRNNGGYTQYPMKYVLDVVENGSFYRVTVWIGHQSLSQVFKPATDGKVYSAGAWVHKE